MPPHHELGLPRRYAIMGVLIATQFVQMMPFGAGLGSSLDIGGQINAPPGTESWIAASYSLTQGAFVLVGGRLGDVYGHKNVLLAGSTWWVIWSIVTGFAKSIVTISLFRGLTGVGAAFVVPNAVALLMHTFPPGRLRNISMGLFGAMAPMGAAGGSAMASLLVQLTEWKWAFFFMGMLGAAVFGGVAILVPQAPPSDQGGKVDWVGAYLGVGGLILFNFVWNQAPSAGWQEPYEYVLLIVSIFHLGSFLFWEAKVASSPILPFDIWNAPSFLALVVVVFFSFMSFGLFSWYAFMWMLKTRHESLLSAAASVQPLTIGGGIAAITSAYLIRHVAAQYILAIGATAMATASIILATMPEQQIYWKGIFPAMAVVAFCPDFIFTASQIIASNSVARKEQGIAGSLIGTLFTYGISTGLGFGATVEVHTNRGGADPVRGYRGALYLGIGFAVISAVLSLLFVRIQKDIREGWDEKVEEEGHSSDTTPTNGVLDPEVTV